MTEDEKAREVKRILAVADYAENTGLIATSNVRGRAAAAHARSDPERTAGNVSA